MATLNEYTSSEFVNDVIDVGRNGHHKSVEELAQFFADRFSLAVVEARRAPRGRGLAESTARTRALQQHPERDGRDCIRGTYSLYSTSKPCKS